MCGARSAQPTTKRVATASDCPNRRVALRTQSRRKLKSAAEMTPRARSSGRSSGRCEAAGAVKLHAEAPGAMRPLVRPAPVGRSASIADPLNCLVPSFSKFSSARPSRSSARHAVGCPDCRKSHARHTHGTHAMHLDAVVSQLEHEGLLHPDVLPLLRRHRAHLHRGNLRQAHCRYDRLHTARARAGCKSSRAGIYVAARASSFAIFARSPASNLFLKCA